MSEENRSKGCWVWAILLFLVLLVVLGGYWYFVNDGFKGTLSGTIAKIRSSPDADMNLQPNLRPLTETPGPGAPEQAQPELNTPETRPPFLGLPELGLRNPLEFPKPSSPSAGETGQAPNTGATESAVPLEGGNSLNPPALTSPAAVLKACVEMLKNNDLVGAERYVSAEGLGYSMGTTTGVNEVLWKGLYQVQSYQSVGYDQIKVSGQTALVPLYASLGNRKVTVAYIVMAHRGDGWKLDHITDPSRF